MCVRVCAEQQQLKAHELFGKAMRRCPAVLAYKAGWGKTRTPPPLASHLASSLPTASTYSCCKQLERPPPPHHRSHRPPSPCSFADTAFKLGRLLLAKECLEQLVASPPADGSGGGPAAAGSVVLRHEDIGNRRRCGRSPQVSGRRHNSHRHPGGTAHVSSQRGVGVHR